MMIKLPIWILVAVQRGEKRGSRKKRRIEKKVTRECLVVS